MLLRRGEHRILHGCRVGGWWWAATAEHPRQTRHRQRHRALHHPDRHRRPPRTAGRLRHHHRRRRPPHRHDRHVATDPDRPGQRGPTRLRPHPPPTPTAFGRLHRPTPWPTHLHG